MRIALLMKKFLIISHLVVFGLFLEFKRIEVIRNPLNTKKKFTPTPIMKKLLKGWAPNRSENI